MIQIVIPRKLLTTNHIYGQRKGGRGRFLKPEAVQLKQEIAQLLKGKRMTCCLKTEYIHIEYYLYLKNFYTRSGSINLKAGDADNFKKICQDAIFETIGINDAAIKRDITTILPSDQDSSVILLRTEKLSGLLSYAL